METTPAFRGLGCLACDTAVDPPAAQCPDCNGPLAPRYDYDHDAVPRSPDALADRRFDGIGRYADLLPFPADAAVSMDEGTTPLVACPSLADELGVGSVHVKDEGANPTGSLADRGMALAVAAAAGTGATEVALPSTGNGAQSAAAYAARAGLDSRAFVPSRSPFVHKAMVNVHGGEMSVVGGRYPDAAAAFADARADAGWHSVAAFETPYRHEGAKTLLFEVVEQLDWTVPDAVIYPVGHGVGLVGGYLGARDLRAAGLTGTLPSLYAAQADGCAPVVSAWEDGRNAPAEWETPDTICGGVEVPDPAGGRCVFEALRETDGGAVASEDPDILESAVSVASHEGPEVGATGGVAAAGAWTLADRGDLGEDDVVVLVNPAAGGKEDDVLRSHLMGQGV